MTLTLDIAQEVVEAISKAALREGRTREELVSEALKRLFLPLEDVASWFSSDNPDDETLSEKGFLMAAEGTRHLWDTPEEDKAWAHL